MRFHQPTSSFVIHRQDLENAADALRWALRNIRACAGLPLGPYEHSGALSKADMAMKSILDAADAIGIDLGATRGSQLDLREPGEA